MAENPFGRMAHEYEPFGVENEWSMSSFENEWSMSSFGRMSGVNNKDYKYCHKSRESSLLTSVNCFDIVYCHVDGFHICEALPVTSVICFGFICPRAFEQSTHPSWHPDDSAVGRGVTDWYQSPGYRELGY
ncbi:hypothetical protein E3N88_04837 [Mikania micrantha]|uniref:Uncharacterized protein n=1 Tax=Mikania micrantha TaxID=192012 RepID=A0A5N6PVK0_9ASTR|nr:hypothetical protein E3N88_04837 [Mikania micrantha]